MSSFPKDRLSRLLLIITFLLERVSLFILNGIEKSLSSCLGSLLGKDVGGSALVGLVRLTSCCCIDAILGDIFSRLLSREPPSDSLDCFDTLTSLISLSKDVLNFLAGVFSTDAGGARGGGGIINAKRKIHHLRNTVLEKRKGIM